MAPAPKHWCASELQAYNSSGRKTNQNTRQAASPVLPSVGSMSVKSPNESLLGLKTLVVGMRNDVIVTSATPRSLIASFSPPRVIQTS